MSRLWSFSVTATDVDETNLPWGEAIEIVDNLECGELIAGIECAEVRCAFNPSHASIEYLRTDGALVFPRFVNRSPNHEQLRRFFCGRCGMFQGPKDEYLANFFTREKGLRFFRWLTNHEAFPASLGALSMRQTFESEEFEWCRVPMSGQ